MYTGFSFQFLIDEKHAFTSYAKIMTIKKIGNPPKDAAL